MPLLLLQIWIQTPIVIILSSIIKDEDFQTDFEGTISTLVNDMMFLVGVCQEAWARGWNRCYHTFAMYQWFQLHPSIQVSRLMEPFQKKPNQWHYDFFAREVN